MSADNSRLQVSIGGMACSFCTQSIEKAVGKLAGVDSVSVSLAHEEALIEYDPESVTERRIKSTLLELGYTIRDPDRLEQFAEREEEIREERKRLIIAGTAAGVAFLLMVMRWLGYQFTLHLPVVMFLALITNFGAGLYIFQKAYASIKRGILNQHVLLEIAALGALAGGFLGVLYFDFPAIAFFTVAIFLTAYHILSGYVSLLVRARSSRAVRELLELQPDTVLLVKEGDELEVPVGEIDAGDKIRIKPGDSIPVDGRILEGSSSVDESLVTGESLPVDRNIGDEVIGGSINKSGTLLVEVTAAADEGFLQEIVRHVEEARALKPSIIQLMDRVLKYYVPGVLAFAGLAFLLWTAVSGLLFGQVQLVRAIFAMLAVLVMGYPCALGMAGPLAMIRGGGRAAGEGILVRDGTVFEIFKDIESIVLDKTGTLTVGKPQVKEIISLGDNSRREVLKWAATAEKHSEHPLAEAILQKAEEGGISPAAVEEFEAISGSGVRAVSGGSRLRVGSIDFLSDETGGRDYITDEVEKLEDRGYTVTGVEVDGRPVGLIAVADSLKDDAEEVVADFSEAGIEPVMLTGDSERTARAVADRAGIERVIADVLPDEKAEIIRSLQSGDKKVIMVGDGINDAPSLMQADIGIAIGAGTDIAIESSDIIITGDELTSLLTAYEIGRDSYRKTVQNLILAFLFNGIGVPLAATGLLHPIWAMVAMISSVSAVLLNSFQIFSASGSTSS